MEAAAGVGPHVVRLTPDEWAEARRLRIAALVEDPTCFGGSLAAEAAMTEQQWREDMARNSWLVARAEDRSVAVAVFFPHDTSPDGAPQLGSMWVIPEWRHRGVAAVLAAAIEREARGIGAAALGLWVTAGNDRARRFYLRLGYSPTGAWKLARREPTVPMERMVRPLRPMRSALADKADRYITPDL